ncbi:general stress protein CsbD [Flavobacterium tructae]|uniref:general stress protein CsbD n=1 Tax=Flavobacterium tructae TaxID=1114873 RepID=UPI002551E496|nr:general stress protein CsbD [Flavobacterium tructae]MDL2141975.1 general stress protein CsbD [Flavobacterium tructae]
MSLRRNTEAKYATLKNDDLMFAGAKMDSKLQQKQGKVEEEFHQILSDLQPFLTQSEYRLV